MVGADVEVVSQHSYVLVGHIPLQQCALGHGTDHIGFFSAQRFNNHLDAVPSCDFTRQSAGFDKVLVSVQILDLRRACTALATAEHDHFTMQIGNHCHCLFQISFQRIKIRCLTINEIHRFREQNVEALRLGSALLQRLLACSVRRRVKAHGLCHRKLNVVIAQFFYKPGIFDAGTDTVSHLAGSFLNAVLPHSLSVSIPCHQPA